MKVLHRYLEISMSLFQFFLPFILISGNGILFDSAKSSQQIASVGRLGVDITAFRRSVLSGLVNKSSTSLVEVEIDVVCKFNESRKEDLDRGCCD